MISFLYSCISDGLRETGTEGDRHTPQAVLTSFHYRRRQTEARIYQCGLRHDRKWSTKRGKEGHNQRKYEMLTIFRLCPRGKKSFGEWGVFGLELKIPLQWCYPSRRTINSDDSGKGTPEDVCERNEDLVP